jgi:hypothetical protein
MLKRDGTIRNDLWRESVCCSRVKGKPGLIDQDSQFPYFTESFRASINVSPTALPTNSYFVATD